MSDYMMRFNDSIVELFKSMRPEKVLPVLKVYRRHGMHGVHLSAECEDGELEYQNFLDAPLVNCDRCADTLEAALITDVKTQLRAINIISNIFLNESNAIKSVLLEEYPNFEKLGMAYHAMLRVDTPTNILGPEEGKYSAFFREKLRLKAAANVKRINKYLKSVKGQKDAFSDADYELVGYTGEGDYVRYLTPASTCSRKMHMQLIAHGDEIVPEYFLVEGPSPLTYLIEKSPYHAAVALKKDTPLEVILTLVALWEPHSKNIMRDPVKALKAAYDLTP